MARFDVYRNPTRGAADVPWLLDVQADLLGDLGTRVVIPLRRAERFPDARPPAELMPVVEVEGSRYVVETPKLAAVPARALKMPVCSLTDRGADITGALDFLFQGF